MLAEVRLDREVREIPHGIVVAGEFPVEDVDTFAGVNQILRRGIVVARGARDAGLDQRLPHRLSFLLCLEIPVRQTGVVTPKHAEILVHLLEVVEVAEKRHPTGVEPAKSVGGELERVRITQDGGVHRRAVVDERCYLYSALPIIVDQRRADADFRRHPCGVLVRFAINVFLGALAGNPQDIVAPVDSDLEALVGHAGHSDDLTDLGLRSEHRNLGHLGTNEVFHRDLPALAECSGQLTRPLRIVERLIVAHSGN